VKRAGCLGAVIQLHRDRTGSVREKPVVNTRERFIARSGVERPRPVNPERCRPFLKAGRNSRGRIGGEQQGERETKTDD
jgi:hypothetical protein